MSTRTPRISKRTVSRQDFEADGIFCHSCTTELSIGTAYISMGTLNGTVCLCLPCVKDVYTNSLPKSGIS